MSESISGNVQKMRTELAQPVHYSLPIGDTAIALNPHIGKSLSLRYTGTINCVACNRKTKKSFNQGYCYPCFKKLARCDTCIIKPELCHFDAGTCREPDWAQANCMQSHYVYLANSSGLKVGITRGNQIPTRWIDQGAGQALPILKVANRKLSGLAEVILKEFVSDRTDWRRMLKGVPEPVDLAAERERLLGLAKNSLQTLIDDNHTDAIEFLPDAELVQLDFPVEAYPVKVSSHNFDKTPEISGKLQGIKGQYLILDSGVLNIRKFGGYEIELKIDD